MRKTVTALLIFITAILAFVITAAAGFAAVVFLAAGILSVFMSLSTIILPVNNLASDLAPTAILFVGFFCVFAAVSIALSLYIYCPKSVRKFSLAVENLLS